MDCSRHLEAALSEGQPRALHPTPLRRCAALSRSGAAPRQGSAASAGATPRPTPARPRAAAGPDLPRVAQPPRSRRDGRVSPRVTVGVRGRRLLARRERGVALRLTLRRRPHYLLCGGQTRLPSAAWGPSPLPRPRRARPNRDELDPGDDPFHALSCPSSLAGRGPVRSRLTFVAPSAPSRSSEIWYSARDGGATTRAWRRDKAWPVWRVGQKSQDDYWATTDFDKTQISQRVQTGGVETPLP